MAIGPSIPDPTPPIQCSYYCLLCAEATGVVEAGAWFGGMACDMTHCSGTLRPYGDLCDNSAQSWN
eukprot:1157679-Pelagomonas_calceolata.AAC.4